MQLFPKTKHLESDSLICCSCSSPLHSFLSRQWNKQISLRTLPPPQHSRSQVGNYIFFTSLKSFCVISNNFCIICVYVPACCMHVFLLALSHPACNLKYLTETLHWAGHMAHGTPAPCSAPASCSAGLGLPAAAPGWEAELLHVFACWAEATCRDCRQSWHCDTSVLPRWANLKKAVDLTDRGAAAERPGHIQTPRGSKWPCNHENPQTLQNAATCFGWVCQHLSFGCSQFSCKCSEKSQRDYVFCFQLDTYRHRSGLPQCKATKGTVRKWQEVRSRCLEIIILGTKLKKKKKYKTLRIISVGNTCPGVAHSTWSAMTSFSLSAK